MSHIASAVIESPTDVASLSPLLADLKGEVITSADAGYDAIEIAGAHQRARFAPVRREEIDARVT